MKLLLSFFILLGLLAGCDSDRFTKIPVDEPFLASINLKDTSITFVDETSRVIASWDIKEPFTGGVLLPDDDTLLVYGKQMEEIVLFSLKEGRQIAAWKTGEGIVNAIVTEDQKRIAAVNQNDNSVHFYSLEGDEAGIVKVGKNPLTLLQETKTGLLYVVNFGDTKLTVIDPSNYQIVLEFPINSFSTGALLRESEQEIWIGGHGKGDNVEESVYIFSTKTGELKKTLKAPVMPVQFLEQENGIFIVSHGSSTVYLFNEQYEQVNQISVGVNPFEIENFNDMVVIAGYDSDEVYLVDPKTLAIEAEITVGKGPFQLITRE